MGSNKLDQLFDVFSANLSLYFDIQDHFLCPLCNRLFDRTGLAKNFNSMRELSFAHFIPDKLGGRIGTLTCTRCNNTVGSTIEAHEIRNANAQLALTQGGPKSEIVKLVFRKGEIESGWITAELKGNTQGDTPELRFNVLERCSHPPALESFNRIMEETATTGNTDWSVTVEHTNTFKHHRACLTYLHIAFLYLFHQFGYEWALDHCTLKIREQLLSPDETIIPIRLLKVNCGTVPSEGLSVHLIYEPLNALGFLVTIPPLPHTSFWTGVWMPLFENEYTLPEDLSGSLQLAPIPDLHSDLGQPSAYALGRRVINKTFEHFTSQME